MVVIFGGTYPYVVGDSYPGGIYPRVVVLQGSCLADYYPKSSYPGVVV